MLLTRGVCLVLFIVFMTVFLSCSEDSDDLVSERNAVFIGLSGGTITVNDPESDIYGTFVEVPPGALKSDTNIHIALVEEGYTFEGDSSGIFVALEPSGIQFEKPVRIGIPYAGSQTPSDLEVYYFDEGEFVWKPLPTVSIDSEQRVVVAETNHFSINRVGKSKIRIAVDLYRSNSKQEILAWVRLQTPLNQMPVDIITVFANQVGYIDSLIEQYPKRVRAHYRVTLKEKVDFWFDRDIDSKLIVYRIPTLVHQDLTTCAS